MIIRKKPRGFALKYHAKQKNQPTVHDSENFISGQFHTERMNDTESMPVGNLQVLVGTKHGAG